MHSKSSSSWSQLLTQETGVRAVLLLGGLLLAGILLSAGALVWGLYHLSSNGLRWWAGLATLTTLLGPVIAYQWGKTEAHGLREGLHTGTTAVMQAASATAALRVQAATALRRPAPPTGVNFNMYLPQGQLPELLPPALPDTHDIELY